MATPEQPEKDKREWPTWRVLLLGLMPLYLLISPPLLYAMARNEIALYRMSSDVPRFLDTLGHEYEVVAENSWMSNAGQNFECAFKAVYVTRFDFLPSKELDAVISAIEAHDFASPRTPADRESTPEVYTSSNYRLITIHLSSGSWGWSFDYRCW